jgi:ketosteroid isomerase-like protein
VIHPVERNMSLSDQVAIAEAAHKIAAAIARRDVTALNALLAPGFVHRTHGGDASDRDGFLRGIERIPGDISFVTLEQLVVDLCGEVAMATGTQHGRVVVDGQVIDDRRGFVDWFVKQAGEWRIQAAVDLPWPDSRT